MKTKVVCLMVWVLLVYAFCIITVQASQGPKAQVENTVNAVMKALKDDSLDRDGKRDKVRDLIRARFDFETMSQRTLATYWKKATTEERERYIDLFSKLLEWTYIGRIEAYTNEMVKYTGEKIKDNRAVVDTAIVTASTEIPIDYKMLKSGDQWRVYDVIIEEVSLVRNYRSSYRSIVKKEGMSGLLDKMEKKVQQLKVRAEGGEKET
jgi:phospholipid transport system substrate-binding protein